MPGADDCWTDHRLLVTKLHMTTCKRPRIQHSGAKRLDTLKLKDPDIAKRYVFGPIRSSTSTLKAADNITELTEPQGILARWQDHFSTLLNRDSSVAPDFLRNVPQHPVRLWMSAIPTYTEFETALKSIQPYKAPGPDNIPLELIKHGGLPLQIRIHLLLLRIWENEEIPADLKDANIITIFKKDDRSMCVLEKCREHQQPLGMIFYDLKKAFDSIPRSAMWQVLERFDCPEKFTTLIRSLHDGTLGRVQHQTGLSEPFPITGGLKQGCVLAPTLFSIYLAEMLHEIPENNPGIGLRYRMDGGLFNTVRFRSRNRTYPMQMSELQYADDNCTISHTLEDLQTSADNFSRAYSQFGLNINIAKTKVLLQPRPGHHTPPEDKIIIRGLELENVDYFTYLGSILDVNSTAERDVNNRLRAAHAASGKLHIRVFRNPGLTQNSKLMVYQAVVISTLLYACATWVFYRKDTVKLERFHQSKLSQILRIKCQDRVTNNEVLLRSTTENIEATMTRHLPKQVLFSELDSWNRPRGTTKRRFKKQLKHTLKAVDINPTKLGNIRT
ncbi:uncharacterized protein LOC143024118 [Oratosquilla oratoria]|uniref:uncharacterized protein LOC143024118 n=1 Tax=Oratosquilla oratoria TaxID=337810 RepID=UPI003F76ECC5